MTDSPNVSPSTPPSTGEGRAGVVDVDTPHGQARVHLNRADRAIAGLVLGHGAGGGVAAPDLTAAAAAARPMGVSVALVEQPYRVAGRRSPAPAQQLDAAWVAVTSWLVLHDLRGLPLVVGGRSMGARVACRTVGLTGAIAVLCLAFPLQPPRARADPAASRLAELDAVAVPTLVVQGARDPFGIPPPGPLRSVVTVDADHGLKRGLHAAGDAVSTWLAAVLG
jgi:predicted alpha/beta-hydrolase family hydrolase